MAYEKQIWQCGDTITADKLNHMEDGIANSGGGIVYITPTVIDGDSMVCFDLGISYNELLQIIGSGGILAEIIENNGAHTIAMLDVYGYNSGQSAYVALFADDPSTYSAQDPDDNLMFCISK